MAYINRSRDCPFPIKLQGIDIIGIYVTFPTNVNTGKMRNCVYIFNWTTFDGYFIIYCQRKSTTCDFYLLLRTYYETKPLYVEIVYFDKKCGTDRGELEGCMILTYEIQCSVDSMETSYDHSEDDNEERLEDREVILENILVYNSSV